MAATIRDVARMTNLSVGTISRYLNGYQLKYENEQKIKQAIKELGFKENLIAKGLKSRRSHTIGVALWSLQDEFITSTVTEIEKRLEKTNYTLILSTYEKNTEQLEQKLTVLKDRFIDGLILFPMHQYPRVLEQYIEGNIPVVIVEEEVEHFSADRVMIDNFDASYKATKALIDRNHREIVFVEGTESLTVNEQNLAGYKAALSDHRIPLRESYILNGEFSTLKAHEVLTDFYKSGKRSTALIVTNHNMTMGALMALYERNLRIPEDISVIGFGDYGLSQITRPSLSVIDKPTSEIGMRAADLLVKRMKGDFSDFPQHLTLKTKLIENRSMRTL